MTKREGITYHSAGSNPIGDVVRNAILDDLEKQGHVLVTKDHVAANHATPPLAPMPAPLTATERSAFLGLQAQARQYEQAINEQERAIVAEIEARLGLDVGAIGKSHTVSAQTWQVVAMPQQDGEEAAASQR